jgi:hypothetical protein
MILGNNNAIIYFQISTRVLYHQRLPMYLHLRVNKMQLMMSDTQTVAVSSVNVSMNVGIYNSIIPL